MATLAQTFRDMGQVKIAALAGTAILILGALVFISLRVSTSPMAPIYTELSMEDSGKIVAELDKMNVPYELRSNGTQVLVPSDQVLRLRLSLAQQGLPTGGSIVGYEIFDRSETLGTSSFVMNINMLRALEGELSRTISSLSQVESSRVNLVVPKQELFAHDKQDPTASVVLKLRGSSELSKEQINAITHLVAAAVPGLKPSKVTIVDSMGKLLAGGAGDEGDSSMVASTMNEYRISYENHLKNKLESLLEQSVGSGKVKVTINADINFDRVVTNSETYDPNGQVVRSVQTGEEKEQSAEKEGKDNTSVANNLPSGQANQTASGSNKLIDKTDETTNYEISKTVENHTVEIGKVNKLSVAVLVDGTYADDAKTGKPVYAPRTPAEIQNLNTLVKSAIGFDEKRGDKVDIVNMRFISPEETTVSSPFEWLHQDLHSIVQTFVFGAVAIMVIMMVIRPLVNRIIETTLAAASSEAAGSDEAGLMGRGLSGLGFGSPATPGYAAAGVGGMDAGGAAGGLYAAAEAEPEEPSIDISRISGRVKSSMYKRLNELVEKHPDEALNVIRQWSTQRG